MHKRFCLIAFIAASSLAAQTGAMAGPQTGYLVDPVSRAVRPVQGLLGGATIGPEIDMRMTFSTAVASPNGDYALGVGAEDRRLWLVRLAQSATEVAVVPGAMPVVDRIVPSAAGSHALLFSSGSRRLQVLAGLPSSPVVAREMDIGLLPGLPTAMSISEDGNTILVAMSDQTSGFLYRFAPQEDARMLSAVSRVSAIAFSSRGDAAFADAGANTVVLIQSAALPGAFIPLVQDRDGVDSPVGLAFAENGSAVYVANGGAAHTVMILDLNGGQPRSIPCPCSPTALQGVGVAAFRLTDALSEAVWFLETGGPEPRIVFVPPPQLGGVGVPRRPRRTQLD
jgi:DNA-binding beta-propeller fold protein YncE